MNWCDPCAADPLSRDELRRLGVFWLDGVEGDSNRIMPSQRPQDVFLTRLHVRYDAAHFPQDLVFQETADRQNFQARYVLRHPWKGTDGCAGEMTAYRTTLRERQEREAQSLASLTGWEIDAIRQRIDFVQIQDEPRKKWWQQLWTD
jgi:hypothetical protein